MLIGLLKRQIEKNLGEQLLAVIEITLVIIIIGSSGPVVGHTLWDQEVPGSIPARGTANFLEQEIKVALLRFTRCKGYLRSEAMQL